jgi:hypothetical protein
VLDAPVAQHLVDQPERAAVGVVRDEDVVAGAQHRAEGRVGRAHAGREGAGVPAALQRGEALLQGRPGRVAGAGVLVPAPQAADAVLRVGGGRVDGRDHRAGGRVGFLTCVDCPGREAVVGGAVRHD